MLCLGPTLPLKEPELFYCKEEARRLSVWKKSLEGAEFSIVSWKRLYGEERKKRFLDRKSEVRFSFSFGARSMAVLQTGKMTVASSLLLTSGASGRVNALLSVRMLKSLVMLINAFVMLLLVPFRGRRRCVAASAEKPPRDEKQEISSLRKATLVRVPPSIVPRRSNSAALADQEVAARRALAIKRATQDNDSTSLRDISLFVTSRGETLFTQMWTPVFINIKGVAIIVHGLNEHSGRYSDFAKQLNANGFKVYGIDWIGTLDSGHRSRIHEFVELSSDNKDTDYYEFLSQCGLHSLSAVDVQRELKNLIPGFENIRALLSSFSGHGGSDGLHGYVHSLDYAVSDMKAFVEKVTAENPGLPCFCFGHSTGAAIVLKALLDPKVETYIDGVVLTSPALRVQASHPIFGMLAPLFSLLLPRYQFNGAKKGMPVSRDPEALVAKYSDPLVYTGSLRIRTGSEILRITTYLQQNLKKFSVPFLVLHGTADTLTDPEASVKLYEEASSTDKSIKLYEGFLHDLLFEPERDDIANYIVNWLNSRVKI